ncbi:MAG: TonB family protein [Pseudomonadota bacterium]
MDSALKQNGSRLLVACMLSLLLHLALLLGLPVYPTGGVPQVVHPIYARLELAANSEPPPREVTLTPAEKSGVPVRADARPEAAEAKAEPKRASGPAPTEPAPAPIAGITLPSSRDPTYYPAKQLDVYPQPLEPVKLNYPDGAAAQRLDGNLLLLLLIDEFGVVNDASVVEARPEGYFEEAALSVFRALRFSPAQKQGHPVKSRVLLQLRYSYGDSTGAVR